MLTLVPRIRPVSVMVVDDSGFMRLALKKMLERDPGIRVVAEARSSEEAVRLAQSHRPDVITMDVEMPGGSGLDATAKIMQCSPCNIIMVSSLTRAAADTTLKAMSLGAVDYIPKASSFVSLDIVAIEKELCRKVHYWAGLRPRNAPAARTAITLPPLSVKKPGIPPDLLVIGASTGGPKLLPQLFRLLPPLRCPVVIALHMPPVYTQSFAEHMAADCGHDVIEGQDGQRLRAGQVVVAPGGLDSRVELQGVGFMLRTFRDEKYGIHPSVDALFSAAARQARSPVAVILSGMGDDGVRGGRELAERQVPLLAQNEASSLVYGMPRAVAEAGLASEALDLAGIAQRLTAWCTG